MCASSWPQPAATPPGQFGKNHLGDRDEFLPTNHGFDEFFGNLYHLNAEEEPERPYWPKDDPSFLKAYNPRGVLHSFADGKIEDTGPLTVKRMETVDDETTKACMDFMTRTSQGGHAVLYLDELHPHARLHACAAGISRQERHAGQRIRRWHVGDGSERRQASETLDDLKIADNTIVIFTTDNGPNMFTWPDAATTPFRSEKDSNWEGAFRVPAMVRWPGHIKPERSRTRCSPGSTGSRPCLRRPEIRPSRTAC